jgi:hypothetical protein
VLTPLQYLGVFRTIYVVSISKSTSFHHFPYFLVFVSLTGGAMVPFCMLDERVSLVFLSAAGAHSNHMRLLCLLYILLFFT